MQGNSTFTCALLFSTTTLEHCTMTSVWNGMESSRAGRFQKGCLKSLAFGGFGDFEGTIPEGQFGAGEIRIWDRGIYDTREWTDDRIVVILHGTRLNGAYSIIRFRRKGEREWLIQKLRGGIPQEEAQS